MPSTVRDAVRRALVPGPIGVACSGGPDSIALAHAAIAERADITVITIDHGINPTSGQVAEQVAAWANGQGARAIIRRVELAERASLEAAARDARYAALDAVAHERGLARILLGHTARDQAETVLLRILRGTGPAGLAGIPAARAPYTRPLLELPRAAIEAYIAEHGLPTWDDPMNADRRFARVRVREQLLPALRDENPAIDDALLRLAASAREWTEVIDAAAAPLARWPIACPELASQPAAIRKRALALALETRGLAYDASHLDALDDLVGRPARGECHIDLPGARLTRTYNQLDVASVSPEARRPEPPPGHELRAWRPGDRMRPARLKGRSRKLSDLYIDAKVPRDLRRSAHVLVRTSDQVIVWAEHLGYAAGSFDQLGLCKRA